MMTLMQRKPSRQSKSLFGNGMGYNIVVEGCIDRRAVIAGIYHWPCIL